MSLRNNILRRRGKLIPHGGVIPTESYTVGANIPVSDITRDADCLFWCSLVYETGDQGIIVKIGGATRGLLAGINGDGDLIVRYGDGSSPPLTNGCRVIIDSGLLPKGRKFDLAFSVDFTATPDIGYLQGIIVWIDGRVVGRAELNGTLADWTEVTDGAYGAVNGVGPAETGVTLAYSGSILSNLFYIARRVAPFGRRK